MDYMTVSRVCQKVFVLYVNEWKQIEFCNSKKNMLKFVKTQQNSLQNGQL